MRLMKSRPLKSTVPNSKTDYATKLVHTVCCLAGPASLLDEIRANLDHHGVIEAVRDHDTPKLFDWLLRALSFQGVSDAVASGYMARHGRATFRAIHKGLKNRPSCPKLRSYWHF